MRGSVVNQVNQLWHVVDGIGEKKKESRKTSVYKGHNGHNVSEKVHAFRSKDEFIRLAKEVAIYAREYFGIKDLQALNNTVIESYIDSKIEDGLMRDSISNYISILAKMQVGLSKMEQKIDKHKELFTQKNLKEARVIVDKRAIKSAHVNRAYINPQAFKSDMTGKSAIGYQLQLEHGLRINEAILIRPSQLLENNTIRVQGKGGYLREVKLVPAFFKQIKDEIRANGFYKQDYQIYLEELKKAAIKHKEKWTGTHGLRYNYAQRKMEEYMMLMTYKEALAKVSFELGHHRNSITKHYLK